MDTIVTLEEYYNVFVKYGTLFRIGEDFDMFDWKSAVAQVVKKTNQWHFRFAVTKRFVVKRATTPTAKVVVQGETGYNFEAGTAKKNSLCYSQKDAEDIMPSKLRIGVPIKLTKKNDVERLLCLHFGESWQNLPQLEFYKDLYSHEVQDGENQSEDENEGGPMEELENSI